MHGGKYILEVWARSGERLYQKIMKEECKQWKLYNNIFVFKAGGPEYQSLIYIMWLNERKMCVYKHPYEDSKEVDFIYFEGSLIVCSKFNFKCFQVSAQEITTYINQFSGEGGDQIAPIIDRDMMGVASQEQIIAVQPNPLKYELIFICQNQTQQTTYYRFVQTQTSQQKRVIQLEKLPPDPNAAAIQKKYKMKKQMKTLLAQQSQIVQVNLLHRNNNIFLIYLKANKTVEVVLNFSVPVYAEQIQKLQKVIPWHSEALVLQFEDGSFTYSADFEKWAERQPITEYEYYKQLTIPPENSMLRELHKNISLYEDVCIVNTSIFLVRDNNIFIYDVQRQDFSHFFQSKLPILGLYKLKQTQEDDQGYRVMHVKVVAVCKNGSLIVFIASNNFLMNDWKRQDINQTAISQQKDMVLNCFQNQNSLSNLYIATLGKNEEQKLYQVMFNTSIIEINQRFLKNDNIFIVNFTTRTKELIGVIDYKSNLIIYKNEKGNMTKIFQINLINNEIRDHVDVNNCIFFFQRECLIMLSNDKVVRISSKTFAVDILQLRDPIRSKIGSCFLDTQYFYFMAQCEETQQYKLAVLGTDMIQSAFNEAKKSPLTAIDLERTSLYLNVDIPYADWTLDQAIGKLDYDEFNGNFNLMTSNLELLVFPIVHRNTINFQGMAERSYYLAYKKSKEVFYALDKGNQIQCWDRSSGQLLYTRPVQGADYSRYELERNVYDKGWFDYFLIYTRDDLMTAGGQEDNILQSKMSYMTFKIIEINDYGEVVERMSFNHSTKAHYKMYLYFNKDLNQMIEILTHTKLRDQRPTYNLYILDDSGKWAFNSEMLTSEDSNEFHKVIFPYNIRNEDFYPVSSSHVGPNDLFKYIGNNKMKVLNLRDGLELIVNLENNQVEAYLGLMYQFQQTKETFYDRRSGQQYVQDVNERLQNFYENLRRKIFLKNKWRTQVRSIDCSSKNFKNKILIEQGFTYLDYRFFKQSILDNQKKTLISLMKIMSDEQLKRMVHNIFPLRRNTIMHYIANHQQGFQNVDYLTEVSRKNEYIIPFIIDINGNTPLDITIANKDFKQTNSLVRMLAKTPLDHHSRLISHQMPKLLEMGVPSLEKYFDKRKFQTGICKTFTLGKLKISPEQDYKAVASTLLNESEMEIKGEITNEKYREQSFQLEVLDLPLTLSRPQDKLAEQERQNKQQKSRVRRPINNEYEVKMITSLANTANLDIFNQQSVKGYVDFIWPKIRGLIVTNILIPYIAFIIYYLLYLVAIKKMNMTAEVDPTFFSFTSEMWQIINFVFRIVLFLGCFYFFQQDVLQIKNLSHNGIVLWSWANITPIVMILFIIIYDSVMSDGSYNLEIVFYSLSAFLVWIRVIHLMKLFPQTAYLLRMSKEIIYRMRWLITFILISLIAFGFTYFFLSDSVTITPGQGVEYMFLVLIGNYDSSSFNNVFLQFLFVLCMLFNYFFIFTLLIALSVIAFQHDTDVTSNEAYQDKCAMTALYSYLLNEYQIREQNKQYLLICTVTENYGLKRHKEGSAGQKGFFGSGGSGSGDAKLAEKLMKSLDMKLNAISKKFERQVTDISDRIDAMAEQQKIQLSKAQSVKKNQIQ